MPLMTTIVARVNVSEIGHLAPKLLVCDLDDLESDRLEMLRQIRFVVPDCIIALYTKTITHAWALSCHLAGVNSVLSKASSTAELALGLREGMQNGCYTDPRFDAA